MRERQQLEASLNAFERIARELDDNIELVALGEEEGDAERRRRSRDGAAQA